MQCSAVGGACAHLNKRTATVFVHGAGRLRDGFLMYLHACCCWLKSQNFHVARPKISSPGAKVRWLPLRMTVFLRLRRFLSDSLLVRGGQSRAFQSENGR
ncbi:unnamed protein product [Effrenium voratum]|nr:unnamed protein product [Effrenium voratum]